MAEAHPQVPAESHTATTEAHGGAAEHHAEPAVFGVLDATVWVSIAMATFIALLLWKKVPGLIARGLDNQIAAIRTRLEEAKQLRAEAEALRDEYARKIAGAEKEAEAMLAHADEEAKAVLAKAEADAKELTKRRQKMAEDKIAWTAAAIIAEKHGVEADKKLVDQTIAGLGRLN